jgi:hypothetical protein
MQNQESNFVTTTQLLNAVRFHSDRLQAAPFWSCTGQFAALIFVNY